MKFLPIAIIVLLPLNLFSVDFSIDELDKYMRKPDLLGAQKYLDSFPAESRDAVIIISRGWVALSWGFSNNLCFDIALANGESLKCYPSPEEKQRLLVKGVAILEKAAQDFPDRIDARLNLVGYYAELGKIADFRRSALALLKHGTSIGNRWMIRGKVPVEEGQQFLLNNLQASMVRLQRIDEREAEAAYIDVAKAMIEFAPNHVFGYNDLGIMYKILKKPKQALPPVLKAHEIDPEDIVVMGNLAQIYIALGEKEKARAVLKRMIAHPSGQFREKAEQMLSDLK